MVDSDVYKEDSVDVPPFRMPTTSARELRIGEPEFPPSVCNGSIEVFFRLPLILDSFVAWGSEPFVPFY